MNKKEITNSRFLDKILNLWLNDKYLNFLILWS